MLIVSVILQVIGVIKQIVYLGLVLSYKTGQLIIFGMNAVIGLIMCLNENIGTALKILFEDFLIFISDIGQRLLLVFTVAYNICESFFGCVVTICETVKSALAMMSNIIMGMYNSILTIIEKTLLAFTQLLAITKLFVTLLGSGVWFAVTLIPGFILYTCTIFVYYVGSLIDELSSFVTYNIGRFKSFIKDMYEFLMDTPVESVVSLIIGTCVLYLLLIYRTTIRNKVIFVLEVVKRIVPNLCGYLSFGRVVFVNHLDVEYEPSNSTTGDSEESEGNSDDSDQSSCRNADSLCLICQERTKCIVLLPCRHVCLCNVCNIRLRNYNRTCPLCRTLVHKTMKVYV